MTGNDIAFVCDDWRVTREEHRSRAARAVTILRELGVGAGDKVGVALKNCPQFFELTAALAALGARAVPIAWRLKLEEVRYVVGDSGAKAVFYDNESADQFVGVPGMSMEEYERRLSEVEPAADFGGGASVVMESISSGTTGRPKAIERPNMPAAAAASSGNMFLEMLGVASPDNIHMMCGPLYHSQPIGFANMAVAAGQRVVMMPGSFDAETLLRTIERERVTWITAVPTHFIRVLALPDEVRYRYDLSSIKMVLHSAAPCPRDVKHRMMKVFPADSIWEVYGGTEGSMSMISPQEWVRKPGSVGKAFPPQNEIRIMDEAGNALPPGETGLIYARSSLPFRYKGAPNLDSETWRGEFFTLGDVGHLDEEGYLFITDRKKDMIISGGANIYPTEVEAALFNHPEITDVAVIGVPDSHWGEKVKAIVELRGQASEQDIIAFCRENLAHYKCPTSVDFIERMPRDPSGKIRKRDLRESYWAEAGRSV